MSKKKVEISGCGLAEKITISRAELHVFVSAFGNKVQAYEAGFAIDLLTDLLNGKTKMKDVAIELIERSKRHEACAMLTAEGLPETLSELVSNYGCHDDIVKLELARLALNLNK